MERDEFEEWLDDNVDEAVERIEGGPRQVRSWIKLLAASLLHLAEEPTVGDDDALVTADDDDDDNLDVLGDDDEEESA